MKGRPLLASRERKRPEDEWRAGSVSDRRGKHSGRLRSRLAILSLLLLASCSEAPHKASPHAGGHRSVVEKLIGLDRYLPGKPNIKDRPLPANEVVDFNVLYQRNCAGCHGANGNLGPAPPLNDPIFLAIVPDAELLNVIRAGRPGTPMPAFAQDQGGPLTAAQVKVLAEGIKPKWQPQPMPVNAPPYLKPRDEAAGSLAGGRKVFNRACASCHGEDGHGTRHEERRLGTINDPSFLQLISNQALRRYAITGRPDLDMPAFDNSKGRGADFQPLTAAEITDLVALFADWRQRGSPNAQSEEKDR